MDAINDFFTAFSSFLWGWPMIILLLGTHIFLTIRLRFPQRKIFQAIKLSVKKDKKATGDVSQFGALATALAATIGTGNIIGVATAIALGGPGAVLYQRHQGLHRPADPGCRQQLRCIGGCLPPDGRGYPHPAGPGHGHYPAGLRLQRLR